MTKLARSNSKTGKTPNPFQKLSISNPFNQKIFKNVHSLFRPGHARSLSTDLEKDSVDLLSLFNPANIDTGNVTVDVNEDTGTEQQNSFLKDPDDSDYPVGPIASHLGSFKDPMAEKLCASPSVSSPDLIRGRSIFPGRYVEPVEILNSPLSKHTNSSIIKSHRRQLSSNSLKQNKIQPQEHHRRSGSPICIPRSEGFRRRETTGFSHLKSSGFKRINSMYANEKDITLMSKVSTASVSCLSSLMLDKSGLLPALAQSSIPTYRLSDVERNQNNQDSGLFQGLQFDSANDMFPRISVDTLYKIIIEGIHENIFDSFLVIDCRFTYEFEGGHIRDAVNLPSQNDVKRRLIYDRILNNPSYNSSKRTLLIFHCEFSSYRGPILASYLRNFDRILNHDNYPKLFYPDILILDGGYKNFYETYPEFCSPCNYVGMNSTENVAECKLQLDKFRRESKRVITRSSSLREISDMVQISRIDSNQTEAAFENRFYDVVRDSPELSNFKFELPPKLSYRDSIISNNSRSSSNRSSALMADILSVTTVSSGGNNSSSKLLSTDNLPFDPFQRFDDLDGSETSFSNIRDMSSPNKLTFFSGVLDETR